ncbi:MAG: hypothetical protein V1765_01855 [bacterium]
MVEQDSFWVYTVHLTPKGKNPEAVAMAANAGEFGIKPYCLVGDFNLSHGDLAVSLEKELGLTHNIEGKTSLKAKLDTADNYLSQEYDNILLAI